METTEPKSSNTREARPRENENQINVSTKRNSNFYVFLGKQILKDHETIELHALGNAVSASVMAAENLVRYHSLIVLML